MMRSIWVITVTAMSACGGTPSIDLDELDAASQAARCTRLVRCGLLASIDACDAYFRIPPPSSFGPAKAAGHLEFDGAQARRCQDALAAQGCDSTSREVRIVPEACTKMFRGRIADGDPCAFDEECTSSRCDQGVCPEGVCCVGVCGETRDGGKLGDACDKSSECLDGFCDADHVCHGLVAAAGTCALDEQCDYGLACVSPSPSIPGECKPLPHVGEACPYQRCAEINTICDATSHCVALGLPGAACVSYRDCSQFAECDMTNHVCIELPSLGMPCDLACVGESWCDFNEQGVGTCTVPQPNGTPCDDSGKCLSQNCKPGTIFDSCQDYPICP
jgi:hypothetical protein